MKQVILTIVTASKQLFHMSITASFIVGSLLFLLAGSAISMLGSNASSQANSKNIQNRTGTQIELTPIQGDAQDNAEKVPDMDTKDTTSRSVTNESTTTVTVNGESVTVPEGESYERSYSSQTNGSNTHVDISIQNHSSADSSSADDSVSSRSRQQTRLDVRSNSNHSTSSSTNITN